MHARSAPHIDTLLRDVPAEGPLAECHLWLIDVLQWVRAAEPVTGLQYVLHRLNDCPEGKERALTLLARCFNEWHTSSLLADLGFAPRPALLSELGDRLRLRLLPASPDTQDLATLFGLFFQVQTDVRWIQALDHLTLARLGELLAQAWARTTCGAWQPVFLSAVGLLAGQVRAAGLSRELRLRMGDSQAVTQTFVQLARAAEDLTDVFEQNDMTRVHQQAHYLRGLIDRCRSLTQDVHAHLEAYGISVDVVFQIDQIQARCLRMEQLLDSLLAPQPHSALRELVLGLMHQAQDRRSVRNLFTRHYAMLSRLVAERNAETGEHYITRNRSEYMDMLRRAAGGGLVIVGTTFVKFFLMALGLSAFWGGFAAGANYAVSFVLIHLLHWTVATKQPAMTAPALAAKLQRTSTDAEVNDFVDEVAHLIRSQVAGIVGNLAVVAPVVVLVQALAWWIGGQPLIDEQQARYVLQNLTLLGPTVLLAAFTGILLFASSLIAGWFENWFVWHRLDSALQWHPKARAWLGPERAQRWALWWRNNISSLAANVSLGLLLGITPALAGFFGLPLDVRHVTLSTGQIAAALGTLGTAALHEAAFWWCVAAIPLTGLFNVGVSFVLALRLAARSRGVRVKDRQRLARALGQRLIKHPGRFLWPPKDPVTAQPLDQDKPLPASHSDEDGPSRDT